MFFEAIQDSLTPTVKTGTVKESISENIQVKYIGNTLPFWW